MKNNQAALLRNCWKQITGPDATQISNPHPAPVVIWGFQRQPSSYSWTWGSMAPARVDLSLATPPAATVHPVGSCCLPSPLLQIGAHWGVRDIGKCPKRHGKVTTELLKWCFSAQPVEKCVGSSQNLKSHWAATNNKSALMQEDQIIVFPPLNQTTFLAS